LSYWSAFWSFYLSNFLLISDFIWSGEFYHELIGSGFSVLFVHVDSLDDENGIFVDCIGVH